MQRLNPFTLTESFRPPSSSDPAHVSQETSTLPSLAESSVNGTANWESSQTPGLTQSSVAIVNKRKITQRTRSTTLAEEELIDFLPLCSPKKRAYADFSRKRKEEESDLWGSHLIEKAPSCNERLTTSKNTTSKNDREGYSLKRTDSFSTTLGATAPPPTNSFHLSFQEWLQIVASSNSEETAPPEPPIASKEVSSLFQLDQEYLYPIKQKDFFQELAVTMENSITSYEIEKRKETEKGGFPHPNQKRDQTIYQLQKAILIITQAIKKLPDIFLEEKEGTPQEKEKKESRNFSKKILLNTTISNSYQLAYNSVTYYQKAIELWRPIQGLYRHHQDKINLAHKYQEIAQAYQQTFEAFQENDISQANLHLIEARTLKKQYP